MNDDFAFRNGFESHYHWIERKIFAEEYIENANNDTPDYKFECFNGIPKMMQLIADRSNSNKRLNYYDMNGNKTFMYRVDFKSDYSIDDPFPKQFELMKEYASILSKDFKYVRVDFYEINGRIYLGELTFTPVAFVFKYKNLDDNIKIGDMLKI